MATMEDNTPATKEKKWDEYEARQYVKALREQQKEVPSPAILRAKITELVCELYLDGYACKDIAVLLSLGKGTPYKIVVRKGIYKRPEPLLTDAVQDQVLHLYRQGCRIKEIVQRMNISKSSVNKIIIRRNAPRRKPIPVKTEKPDEQTLKKGIEMYQEGSTMQDILAATGMASSHHLYIALRESGIPMRDGLRGNKEKREAAQERALHLYRETNLTLSEILKETGVPVNAFRRLLAQREIPLRPLGASDEQKEEAVRLYQQGLTLAAIRQETGVHSGTLGTLLKNRGIPLRFKGELRQKMKDEAAHLYRQGVPIKEIKEKTGISKTVLEKVRKEKNIRQDRRCLVGQMIEKYIVHLVEQGESTKEISKQTGIKVATIDAIRRRYGVPGGYSTLRLSLNVNLSDEVKEKALRMRRQGDSMAEIKRRTGVYYDALKKLLDERNIWVTIKQRAKKPVKGRMTKALEMYRDKYPLVDIKKATGVSAARIYEILHKENLPLRDEIPQKQTMEESGAPPAAPAGKPSKRSIPLKGEKGKKK